MFRLRHHWESLRSNFWFIPCLIILACACLGILTYLIDPFENASFFPRVSEENDLRGNRIFLITLATAMITVASIVFSITIVSLTQASMQYTSLIMGNFMRNRFTQIALGTFGGIFVYCVVLIPAFNTTVNYFAVVIGSILAIGAIFILIFFIHHVVLSLQAPHLIESIKNEILIGLEKAFPRELASDDEEEEKFLEGSYLQIPCCKSGYIETTDYLALSSYAKQSESLFEVRVRTGEFVHSGKTLIHMRGEKLSEGLVNGVNACFAVGLLRTSEQDPRYGIQELVDIALKAMSPAVNDQSTALMVLEQLKTIFIKLSVRKLNYTYEYLYLPKVRFEDIFWDVFYVFYESFLGKKILLKKLQKVLSEISRGIVLEKRKQSVERLEQLVEEELRKI